MSRLKNSIKISTTSKAEVCADIVLFMYRNRKDYISPYSEISKTKDGWNTLEVKVDVKNFDLPDIPYITKEKCGKNKWKFKFVLECPYDTTDYSIINRNDLTEGEKILSLVMFNWSSLYESEFGKVFYSKMPKEFLIEKFQDCNI